MTWRWVMAAMMTIGNVSVLAAAETVVLVRNHQPQAALLVMAPEHPTFDQAAQELQQIVRESTGATLPIVPYADAAEVPPGHTRVFIGWHPDLARWFTLPSPLGTETSIQIVNTHGVLLAGDDHPALHLAQADRPARYLHLEPIGPGPSHWRDRDQPPSPSTLWAVHQLLEEVVGVRWLWPGETGTFVPQHADLSLPMGQRVHQPRHVQRRIRMLAGSRPTESRQLLTEEQIQTLQAESREWALRHRMGSRGGMQFGHAFRHWWNRYHQEHPDYFAVPLEGFSQPFPRADRVKLNVGNPQVIDRILQEWQEAGMPETWNVCPNDGSGYCIGEASRAMDDPPNQAPEDIWRARADLSARYVRFWNQILRRMKALRPDATIAVYAYSTYRRPPEGIDLEPGMIVQIVDDYDQEARENWLRWSSRGPKMLLRPNWHNTAAVAPVLPLEPMADYFRFADANGMVGFDFDSIRGNWATEGLTYYLFARLSQDTTLTTEQIVEEYVQAFGSAADPIRRYFAYWQTYTGRTAYSVPVGGDERRHAEGLYDQAIREHDLEGRYPLMGSWEVLPYLYPDTVLAPARELLQQAYADAAADTPIVRERIAFLEQGLDHLALTRDVIGLAMSPRRTEAEHQMFLNQYAALGEMRRDLSMRHVVWGETLNFIEDYYRIASTPRRAQGRAAVNLDGM